MMIPVCAILAAGASARMGRDKATLRIGGATLLERAVAACADYDTIVVVPSRLAADVPPGVEIVANDDPRRGMTHSARLADAAASPRAALIVVLVDMPNVDGELIRWVAEAPEADVAYPFVDGRPGHPVRFGPRARAKIAALPDGDTLRLLRDDPELSRTAFVVPDARSQLDLDTPDAVRRFRADAPPRR